MIYIHDENYIYNKTNTVIFYNARLYSWENIIQCLNPCVHGNHAFSSLPDVATEQEEQFGSRVDKGIFLNNPVDNPKNV